MFFFVFLLVMATPKPTPVKIIFGEQFRKMMAVVKMTRASDDEGEMKEGDEMVMNW